LYRYTAYGLSIHSELALPELLGEEKASDVTIRVRKLESLGRTATGDGNSFLGAAANVGVFAARNGREIIIDPVPGVDEALLRTFLLGPIFAVLLRQRGLLVLHASATVWNGAALAFMGGSGLGKSTLALSFYARGCAIITDDLMAVRVGPAPPEVPPGYPRVKLLPDAAAALGYAFEKLPALHTVSEKHVCPVTRGFPQLSLPLRRIYMLETGSRNEIVPLSPQEAFVGLMRNSRAVGLLTGPHFASSHLHHCARLVKDVPIHRLRRKPSLLALADLVQSIEEDLT
jgi:hypothetical protein